MGPSRSQAWLLTGAGVSLLACTQPKPYVATDAATITQPRDLDGSSSNSATQDIAVPLSRDAGPDVSPDAIPSDTGASTSTVIQAQVDVTTLIRAGGDFLVAGEFRNTVDFGGTKVTSAGSTDVFLARYKPDGALVSVKTFGTPDLDYGPRLALLPGGEEFLLTARFQDDRVSIGDRTLVKKLSATEIPALAKFTLAGEVVWATVGGGTDIAVGASQIAAAGDNNGVEFYDVSGTLISRRSLPHVNTVAFDAADNLFSGGEFFGTRDFGGITLTATLSPELKENSDGYIVKQSPAGIALWAEAYSGPGYGITADITIDAAGDVYVAGAYRGELRVQARSHPSAGDWDYWVGKHDSANGRLKWLIADGDARGNGAYVVYPLGPDVVAVGTDGPLLRRSARTGEPLSPVPVVGVQALHRSDEGILYAATWMGFLRVPGY